ncbi:rhodanese-like domain-containing protein [Streptomyces sp. H10-C2]|uniref:rhodanese-like domain-containing protein n=1 Tax=unclassified Streptomyces TaxID=2593676 RepID=UPI0024BBB666|nr:MULTISPECIES: rhodanese-like domain-containing protein [unclassified Streptomyces]MDJ0347239.1 rhodanese-like domain-containing protein [Streptomyces sp. PH10-H1]MDJ0375474.1 rhodanese-like domain-containing protein [Streptomyces sp. H10-C2]
MTALITRDELKAAIHAGTVTIVDALGGEYYAKQHLPGALALVLADTDTQSPTLLPDRNAAIVTYCSNPACPNSGQVADRLTALGYTNVRKYREGIQDWADAGLPTESA